MYTLKRKHYFGRLPARRLGLAIVTACVSMASVAQVERLDLPDMGASADTIISRAEEDEYARALVRQMRAYEVLNEDPLISAYFEDMGFRLASNSDRPDKSFTFVVINQDVVNATSGESRHEMLNGGNFYPFVIHESRAKPRIGNKVVSRWNFLLPTRHINSLEDNAR